MTKYIAFLILVFNLLLCGVVSAQPLRRITDNNGVSVDFATSAKQDTNTSSHGTKLDRIETTNNAVQSAVELVRWIDMSNTTSSTLGNGEVFSGQWVDVTGFMSAIVVILTDQDSATNGFEIQSSDDSVDVTHIHQFTVDDNSPLGQHLVFTLVDKYYRIKYTNGTTPQGSFHLSTSLSKTDATHSHTHPVNYPIRDTHEAQLVRSILSGKNPGGTYINFQATNTGNFKASLEELENKISVNGNSQLKVTEYNSVGSELWDSEAHAGYTRISDGTSSAVFDSSFKALLIQEIEHGEIHKGCAYVTEAIDESMANNETIVIAFKTPAVPEVHMVVDFGAKSSAHVELIEAPVWSTGTGSQLPVYNRDRNSANTTSLLEDTGGSFVDSDNVVLNPTNLAGGTVIPDGTLYVFAPTGLGSTSRSRGTVETILAVSTLYAFKFEADAGTNAGHLKLRWYEHTPE
jgi:hypothetical protein